MKEAINLAKEGRQIAPARGKPVIVPPELKKALRVDKSAGENFKNLRLGLQREYAEYVVDAKRDDTKFRRIQKILPMIRNGVGLHDKYR